MTFHRLAPTITFVFMVLLYVVTISTRQEQNNSFLLAYQNDSDCHTDLECPDCDDDGDGILNRFDDCNCLSDPACPITVPPPTEPPPTEIPSPTPTPTLMPAPSDGCWVRVHTTGTIYLRSSPEIVEDGSNIINDIAISGFNVYIRVLSGLVDDQWYQVNYQGTVGWIDRYDVFELSAVGECLPPNAAAPPDALDEIAAVPGVSGAAATCPTALIITLEIYVRLLEIHPELREQLPNLLCGIASLPYPASLTGRILECLPHASTSRIVGIRDDISAIQPDRIDFDCNLIEIISRLVDMETSFADQVFARLNGITCANDVSLSDFDAVTKAEFMLDELLNIPRMLGENTSCEMVALLTSGLSGEKTIENYRLGQSEIEESIRRNFANAGVNISATRQSRLFGCRLSWVYKLSLKADELTTLSEADLSGLFEGEVCSTVGYFISTGKVQPFGNNPCSEPVTNLISGLPIKDKPDCLFRGDAAYVKLNSNGLGDIYVLLGSEWVNITNTADISESYPALSPDGKVIAYVARLGTTDLIGKQTVNTDGAYDRPTLVPMPNAVKVTWYDSSKLLVTLSEPNELAHSQSVVVDAATFEELGLLIGNSTQIATSSRSYFSYVHTSTFPYPIAWGYIKSNENSLEVTDAQLINETETCDQPGFWPDDNTTVIFVCPMEDKHTIWSYHIPSAQSQKQEILTDLNLNGVTTTLATGYLVFDDGSQLYLYEMATDTMIPFAIDTGIQMFTVRAFTR